MNILKLASTALLLYSVSSAADFGTRIVGGTEAAPGEFPYIVSLHERGSHICGGSLIKKNWVITAQHCVTGTKINEIFIGLHDQNKTTGAEKFSPKRIVKHPQYDSNSTDYDFALIELNGNSTYPAVELNDQEITISDDPGKQIMSTTAGWGETNPVMARAADQLQRVDVPLATTALC